LDTGPQPTISPTLRSESSGRVGRQQNRARETAHAHLWSSAATSSEGEAGVVPMGVTGIEKEGAGMEDVETACEIHA